MSWKVSSSDKNILTEVVVVQTSGLVQTFSTVSVDKILIWGNVIKDRQNMWNNTTKTFTAASDGNYLFVAKLFFTSQTGAGGARSLFLFKNGLSFVNLDYRYQYNLTPTLANGITTIRLNKNDQITFFLFCDAQNPITQNDPTYNSLTITQLSS